MNSILLRFNKSLKKISVSRSYSAIDLGHLIAHTFQLKDKVVGLTDRQGKFFDLDHVSKNLSSFKNETMTLVVSKELNEDNMSFSSSYLEATTPDKALRDETPFSDVDFSPIHTISTEASLGHIEDLPFFEKLFLTGDKPTVIVKSKNLQTLPSISCFTMRSSQTAASVIIYLGQKKVCQLYVDNWSTIEDKVKEVISREAPPKGRQEIEAEQKGSKDYSFEPTTKQFILEMLRNLMDNEDINEVEYLRLKCQLLQHPQQFMQRYDINDDTDAEALRAALIKSRQAKARFQNFKRGNSRERVREHQQPRKYEIPIIVRKNNNIIQKISTNYPISFEQEHSMNLIAELELKGLATESEANLYKTLVLNENQEMQQIFMDYFHDEIDQIELARRLKLFKRKAGSSDMGRWQSSRQPQPLMKLILKYATHNNLQLLRRLTVQSNPKLISCYQHYISTGDEELFSENLNKIASYYRIKEDLEGLGQPTSVYSRRHSRHNRDRIDL